ncbi:MAG: hypothetical protein Q9174_003545 [Haloplaca sp. 1 TL-2023]
MYRLLRFLFSYLYLPLTLAGPARFDIQGTGLYQPSLNLTDNIIACDRNTGLPLRWTDCLSAWQKMADEFNPPLSYHLIARHLPGLQPPGTLTTPIRWLSKNGLCSIDLTMTPARTPRGQRDVGDDVFGEHLLGAARAMFKQCTIDQNKGGVARLFSRTNRLVLTAASQSAPPFSYECRQALPGAPITDDVKEKAERALLALPTNMKKQTTFNYTRAAGPAGTRAVTYLLPRREPPADEGSVLKIDMEGNEVEQCSAWDIWTADVALNTLCVQKGEEGYAWHLGSKGKINMLLSSLVD